MSLGNYRNYSQYYRWITAVAGLFLITLSVSRLTSHPFSYQLVAVPLLSLIFSRFAVLGFGERDDSITNSETFVYLALLLGGWEFAIPVAFVVTYIESTRFGKSHLIHTSNAGIICISFFASTFVVESAFGQVRHLANSSRTFVQFATALLLTAVLHGVFNVLLVAILFAIRSERVRWYEWVKNNLWILLTSSSGAIIAAVVNALVHYYGFWAIFSTVPLLAGAYAIALPYVKNIEAARKHSEEIDNLHNRTLEAFATAVDAKDQITHDHVKRVQIYAEGVARLLNLNEEDIKALHAGALLHDIGKIAVPDYILNKPGKLTAAEFDKMKIHTVVGSQILDQIKFPYPLVPIVRYHHERWDGRGYPDGLKGTEIPLTARILSIVDCFDAVREDRQYRKGMTREQGIKLLEDDRGKAFDPDLVNLFVENLPTFEEQIAKARKDAQVFKPVEITETAAIRDAKPAAGLAEEKSETPAFVQAIRASREISQTSYALFEIAECLAGQLEINNICSLIGERIDNAVPFDPNTDTCVFYWFDDECREASVQHITGSNSEKFSGCSIKPGEGVTGWVLVNGKPFSNTDPALDLYILSLSKGINEQFPKYQTLAVFPLVKGEEMLGAMAIYSRSLGSFNDEQLQRLERVAKLASDALSGAKTFANAHKLAMTDALTGLPNARFLHSTFDREKRASANDKFPLTLLLTDLGHFREASDKFENRRADQTIREIASVMLGQIRGTDTLVHYLGDEFIVMLRNTPAEMVVEVIARIQSSIIESRPAVLSPDEAMLGVCIGQATLGADGESLDSLLDVAQVKLQADRSARQSLSNALAA